MGYGLWVRARVRGLGGYGFEVKELGLGLGLTEPKS